MAIAYRILRDADLAEDAVQSALIKAWRELRTLRDPQRFEPWLHHNATAALRASIEADARADSVSEGRPA